MIWNNFKKLIKSKLKKGLDKNQSLEKMSRPRITFPGLPRVTTRPDQEVQPIESTGQKELFGRKVSADIKDQSAPVYQAGTKVGERLVSRKDEREAEAKKISGQFNRRTVGLNVNTKHGPKSAALVGKLRSKFEEGDEEHQAKIAAHKEKRLAAIKEHNQKVDDWNKKGQEIRAKMQQASTPEEQAVVWGEYNKHRAAAPKFKAPRTPSKKAKKTSDLSPEQAALRGKSVSATIEHEGFHHIFDDIEHKYGKVAAINARKKILQQHNLDTLSEVGSFISTRLGYNPKSSHFSEEILAHSRDILVNPVKREAFKKFLGTEKADKHIKNLKQGHQRAYEAAKNLKLEDIAPAGSAEAQPKKLAASELKKAPSIAEQDDSFAASKLDEHAFDPRFHHQLKSKDLGNGFHYHTYTDIKNPSWRVHSISQGNPQHPVSIIGGFELDHKKDHNPQKANFIAAYTATEPEHQGKGHGTRLKLLTLRHHKKMISDGYISPAEHKSWQKLSQMPEAKVKFGETDEDFPDWDEDAGISAEEQAAASPHVASYVKPKKLAASELAKAPTENEDTVKLYHITDKANFKLNPNYAPEDNAIAIQDRSGRKGIYTAPSVEEWVNGHGYARPFVAELHVPKSLLSDKSVGGRWGREKFIPAEHFDKVKVHRVIPIDAHARETYGSHGWFEGESKEEFDTGKPIATKGPYPFKGYQYGGKDAREMAPDEVKQIKQRFNRGYKARFGKSELAKAPIAYHGSTRAFEEHEKPKKDVKTILNYGPGIYYATDPEEASQYAEPQIARVSAHVEAYHDIMKEPSYKAYRDEIAQKFGLDSSVDTRHKNWGKFRDHMLQYEMQKVSEKLGLTPNVRRSDVQVKNAFDPYNKNHAMAVYRVLGHEPNQFRLKNEHKAGTNLYHHIAHEIPKFDNMQWGERTWHLNRAIKKAGFDGIHDKKLGHIIAFSPKQIKPAYGSQKKTKKLAASEMEKGSFQRRNKFNPKDVDPSEQEAAYNWTNEDLGYLSEYEGGDEESPTPRMHRDALDRVQGPLRSRALQKLSSATRIRRAPDGKREFLLHRGYGDNEPATFDKDSITHLERTSWTPHYHIANKFSKKPGGQVVSAWVHEDNIASMPMMYGKLKSPEDAEYDDFGEAQLHDEGESKFSDEKEVIVDPHTSKLHDLKNDPLAPKDLRSITPSDLNLRITERGKKTGFFNRSSLGNTLDTARAGNLPQKLGVYRQDKDSTKMAASEKLEKALSPEEIRSQGYSFKILKPTSKGHLSGRGFAVRAYHNKKPIGHAVFEQIKDQDGYHSVYNSNLEEAHRGKGLYQHMLKIGAEHVKSLGGKGLKSQGFQRSPDATRAWDKIATHAIDRRDVSRGDPQRRADYYLAASELDKAVRSPRKGHTIAQLQRLKEMGWHNPDTGTEMQPEESEEHLMRLMERKAARQTERKVKETKAKASESPADWFEAPKDEDHGVKKSASERYPYSLLKGARGDWKKEGITLSHIDAPDEGCSDCAIDPMDDDLRISAKNTEGQEIAHAHIAVRRSDSGFYPRGIHVDDAYHRKGIATAIYEYAEKLKGRKLRPGSPQSEEAQALWNQPNLPFGLKKGAQGDWQKEGYSFKHYPPKSESDSLHSVTAHSADGTLIGRLRAEDLNDGTFQALDVQVHPEHRRKGLASAMYGLIEKKTGLRAVPDLEAQSPEGKALWSQKTRSFGKSEFVNKKTLKKAPVSLLHFSPKEGLKEIDPKFARTGADKTAKHHQTEHPHSFYYRKGTTLPPADAHVWSGATQYEIEIPDDARLYDIGSDPEKHIKQLHEFSKEKPVNPGLVTMDDIHGMLKELGYHGFYNSNHPQLSNVVGLYHSQPVKKEG